MMRWIIGSSIKLRLVVVAIAALLMVFGFTQLSDMPMDALPEFSRPYVEVQAEALGLSAQEVEALLTTPLEADLLNGVSWVEEIRSQSLPGMASIVLVFEKGTPIMRARQMVQERLVGIHALPNVSTPPTMLNPLSSASRCMEIGLTSDKMSLIEMSVLARWTIKPRLMGVHGVANVSIWGQRERQLQVQVDPARLAKEDISLMQIIKTTGNALWVSPLSFLEASSPGTGGWIDTPNQRLGIRHLLPITTAEDLAKIPIDGNKAKRLGDVATVVEDHQPLIGDAIVNDAPALMLVVEKFPWANTTEVTEGVEAALAALRPGLAGLNMDPTLFRPATYIEEGLGNFSFALMIGGILMIVALFAFLFNWRTTLISAVAVILSLITAGAVLYIFGTEMNMMIIAGIMLAVVAIIDDAVIDVGNIVRRFRQAREEHNDLRPSVIVTEAAMQMRKPALYATVIMVITVVPFLFLEGVSGAFYGPVATSYILALLASLTVTLTVTPVLSLLLLRKAPLKEGDSPVTRMLRSIYNVLFGWAARTSKPVGAFVAVCILVVFAVASMAFLREESLLPDLKETDLVVRLEGNTGASHPAMSRITTRASRELRKIPGVRNVSAHIGRAIMGDEQTNINSGEFWINIDPSADYEATVAAAKQVISGYPGLSPEVLTYRQAQVRQELSGTGESLVVRVYGDDFDVITQKAEEVQKAIAGIDGIVDAKVQYPDIMPTLEIEVDLDRAKLYGLKPGDVRRTATTLASGLLVGNLFEEQKVFDVVVFSTPETRHSISSIENLLIDTPSGGHVMLKEVAHVRIAPSPTVIQRDAVARCMDVTANVRGRDLVSVAADVENGIQKVSFPLEYRAELLGEYADRLAAQNQVISFAIAAILGIFLLLQAFFKSWRLATAVFFTLPMALVGGMLAVFIASGGIVSFGSTIGFIAIYGIAVRQSLALVSHYRDLERDNGDNFDAGLIQRGTLEQSAPILITAITAILAILPLIFLGSIAGLEILHPMAIVMLGGIITTTLYTLVGIPAMYRLFGRVSEEEKVEAEVFA